MLFHCFSPDFASLNRIGDAAQLAYLSFVHRNGTIVLIFVAKRFHRLCGLDELLGASHPPAPAILAVVIEGVPAWEPESAVADFRQRIADNVEPSCSVNQHLGCRHRRLSRKAPSQNALPER
jgi:hypothetical protein